MREQRWFRIAVLAVGLFVVNAVARLVVRFGFDGSDRAQTRASIVMFECFASKASSHASARGPPR